MEESTFILPHAYSGSNLQDAIASRHVKTNREGRKCKKCGRPLSVYNDGDECYAHTGGSRAIPLSVTAAKKR